MQTAMKNILHEWHIYLLTEDLDQIKRSELNVAELIDKVSDIGNREQLQKILTTLVQDPDIAAAAKAMQDFAKEASLDKDFQKEGVVTDFIDDAGRKAYIATQAALDTPSAKKLMTFAPPLVALAGLVVALGAHGQLDPEIAQSIMQIAKTTGKTDLSSVANFIGDAAQVVAESEKEEISQIKA
tara:strand:+ start:50 stop:601 length:552 start_codon:yes stop_codon:yes gene_type:complete